MVAVGVKPPECSWAALGKVPLSLGTWWPLQQHIRTRQPTQSFQTSAGGGALELPNSGN